MPEGEREVPDISGNLLQTGRAISGAGVSAVGNLASTKRAVDSFNRQQDYQVREANRARTNAIVGAALGIVGGGIGLAVGAGLAGTAAASQAATLAGSAATNPLGISSDIFKEQIHKDILPGFMANNAATGSAIGTILGEAHQIESDTPGGLGAFGVSVGLPLTPLLFE